MSASRTVLQEPTEKVASKVAADDSDSDDDLELELSDDDEDMEVWQPLPTRRLPRRACP
eukprot:SAG11_NODE_15209_length_585_cov_1.374486_1_plen_59_part_00